MIDQRLIHIGMGLKMFVIKIVKLYPVMVKVVFLEKFLIKDCWTHYNG